MHALTFLASSDDSSGGGAGGLIQLGILLLIPLAMYFLMIRPQRRRMRDAQSMQSSLDVGDEVITTSGMYGFITGFEDDRIWLEIDDDVQIRVAKGAIQGKVDTGNSTGDGKPDGTSDTVKAIEATVTDAEPTDTRPADSGGKASTPKTSGAKSPRLPKTSKIADRVDTDTAQRDNAE